MAVLLSFVVAGVAWGQADPAQAALQILRQHLDDDSVILSILVTEWGAALSLPADALQARAQSLVKQVQEMLEQPACQEMLKQRWAAAQETKGVNARRAIAFLQELAKSTGAALSRPDEYTLKSLVESAALKKGLSSWHAGCALRVAVGFNRTAGTTTRAPIDTLYLQVLSKELLELVPGILDSYEKALTYHKYWHVLSPTSLHAFWCFFLTDEHKRNVRDFAAQDLISGKVCRGVARPPSGLPLQYPLLTVYAAFNVPEAHSGKTHRSGSLEIGRYPGMPHPASRRRITKYSLNLHQTLTMPGSPQPIWEDLGAAALKVTEYGPHPDDPAGTGPHTYPVKVEYQESIVEPVFIEFLREKLCPAVR
ncbi:MAG: hypothetical protein WDA75_08620 [Candidatus Latescibacterota bacterium]